MIGRIGRHHRYGSKRRDAIRMGLQGRVPEILRPVLLAHEEPAGGRQHIARKRKRKRNLNLAAIRPTCFPGEIKQREAANPGLVEQSAVLLRVG